MLLTPSQIKLLKKTIKDGDISVLLFDLETSPSKFWGFSTGEQYVSYENIVEGTETKVITAQWKWLLKDKKASYSLWKYDEYINEYEDTEVVRQITALVNSADLVIGQNINGFDIRVLQERNKLLKLAPIFVDFPLDTLPVSRRSFKAMSHKLDHRSKQQGCGGKIKMTMSDWTDILEGKVSPLKKMVPYGLKDVEDTETVFWNELPYWNLPQATYNKILKLIGLPKDIKPYCKVCAGKRQKRFDVKVNKKGKITCNSCGTVSYIENL